MSHGHFQVDDAADRLHAGHRSDDGAVNIEVRARQAERLPDSSLFDTLDEASEFFRRDSVGYSPAHAGCCEGVQLQAGDWNVAPLEIECAHSNWFDDQTR